MIVSLPSREIRIRSHTLDRLLLYTRRCPVGIGGLGNVSAGADGRLITDVFLLAQRVTASETELDTAGNEPERPCRAIDREILEKVWAYRVVDELMRNEGMARVPTKSPIPLVLEALPPRLQPADVGEGK